MAKDPNLCNAIHMSVGFFLLFLGFNTAQNFSTSILGDIGAISLAICYFVAAVFSIFVPSVISMFPSVMSLMWVATLCYALFLLTYIYIVPWLVIVLSFVLGFGAANLYSCEGMYLNACCTDKDRGMKTGVYWCYCIIAYLPPSEGIVGQGWQGTNSILFIILAVVLFIGVIVLATLRKPTLVPGKGGNEGPLKLINEKDKSVSLCQRVMGVLKLLVNPRMLLIEPLMFCNGYIAIFAPAQVSRQIRNTSIVGLCTVVFSVVEIVFSFINGWFNDKVGNWIVIVYGSIAQAVAMILSLVEDQEDQRLYMLFIAYALYGVGDSVYQNQALVLTMNTFPDQSDNANSVFRLVQFFACGVCFVLAPLFVSNGSVVATHDNFLIECYIPWILLLLSLIFFFIFQFTSPKKDKKIVAHTSTPSTAKDVETIAVENKTSEQKEDVPAVTVAENTNTQVTPAVTESTEVTPADVPTVVSA
ncbi:hypothetical protein WA158_001642 [Blastocystis sp. Blastoise]